MVIEDLIARDGALEAQRIEVLAGGGSGDPYTHPGEEFVYVLSGSLTFLLDEEERYDLDAGDALAFPSTRSHRWWNDGSEPATVLWINAPVVDAGPSPLGRRRIARRRAGADGTSGGAR